MIHRVCFHLNFFNPTKHPEYIYTWINVHKWSRKSHINLRLCLLISYSANIMPGTVLNILHILTCYNYVGQSPFWWQRGTLKHREMKPPAQPHTADTTGGGLSPDCWALESTILHHLSPMLRRRCLGEMKLRMVIERKFDTQHSVPLDTMNSLMLWSRTTIHANSCCWVVFGWFLIFLI